MSNKKGSIEPYILITGIVIITGGLVYIYNNPWGIVIASIGLIMEAIKQVLK